MAVAAAECLHMILIDCRCQLRSSPSVTMPGLSVPETVQGLLGADFSTLPLATLHENMRGCTACPT